MAETAEPRLIGSLLTFKTTSSNCGEQQLWALGAAETAQQLLRGSTRRLRLTPARRARSNGISSSASIILAAASSGG